MPSSRPPLTSPMEIAASGSPSFALVLHCALICVPLFSVGMWFELAATSFPQGFAFVVVSAVQLFSFLMRRCVLCNTGHSDLRG